MSFVSFLYFLRGPRVDLPIVLPAYHRKRSEKTKRVLVLRNPNLARTRRRTDYCVWIFMLRSPGIKRTRGDNEDKSIHRWIVRFWGKKIRRQRERITLRVHRIRSGTYDMEIMSFRTVLTRFRYSESDRWRRCNQWRTQEVVWGGGHIFEVLIHDIFTIYK